MERIKSIAYHITLLVILASCVKSVDFSGAYEKKVVVNCILHSRARYYEPFPDVPGTPAPRIPITIKYEQQTDFDIQHLYLSYNSIDADGNYERIAEATAILYNDITGEQLGQFVRVSDYEWQLHYHIPYEVIDDSHKKYSMVYRLEITDIQESNTITAYSSFNRTVGTKAIRIDTYEDVRLYEFKEDIIGPTWITCLAFDKKILSEISEDNPNYFGLGRVNEKWIRSYYRKENAACPYADNFNFDEASSVYAGAIRLMPAIYASNGSSFGVSGRNSDHYSEMLINFVSEDYDRFLKESIIYEMRHGNEADPTKHLYEDQIYSNINGGIGVFGIEAAYIFSQKDFSYNSQLFADNQ